MARFIASPHTNPSAEIDAAQIAAEMKFNTRNSPGRTPLIPMAKALTARNPYRKRKPMMNGTLWRCRMESACSQRGRQAGTRRSTFGPHCRPAI